MLQLIKSLGRGGAEVLLVETHNSLSALGVQNTYAFFLPWKAALQPDLEALGARVVNFPARTAFGVLWRARSVARFIEEGRFDLVHAHLPVAGASGRIAGWLSAVPVVYTEHNLQERYRVPTRILNAITWRSQAHVVAVSEPVRASIQRHLGSTVPTSVVANGVDTARFAPDPIARRDVRQELGIAPTAPVIGTVAVFRKQKRLDRWLKAASLLARWRPDLRCVLLGDGPERVRVERWILELSLEENVLLPGLKADPRRYLSGMDLYMMSSDFEGLPVAMLEAMAMGLPIVATRVGGVGQAVRDLEEGLLVDPNGPKVLAQAARAILEDPRRGVVMGRRARQRVLENFSVGRMARGLYSVYQRVLVP